MLDALASTGSGTILDKPGEAKGQWIFDAAGQFTVQSSWSIRSGSSRTGPSLRKGVIPSAADRIESGVLGSMLGFGGKLPIHGTLHEIAGQECHPWLYSTE
jgi:L,D-transpeptidase YbiS